MLTSLNLVKKKRRKAKYSSQIIIDKTDKKKIKAFERAIEELKGIQKQ